MDLLEVTMERAPLLVFPGAILGSLLIGFFGFYLSSGISLSVASDPSIPEAIEAIEPIGQPDQASENTQVDQPQALPCEVSQQYPKSVIKWCGVITKYARQNDLHPDLIAAMIWQESGGNPKAYSNSGAVGLMQIMPSDGIAASFICSSGACFASRPTIKQLKDPEFNVKYGTRMLARLVKTHGSLRDGLKAYGPMDSGYYYADKVLSIYKHYGN